MFPYRLLILASVITTLGLTAWAYRAQYVRASEKLSAAEAKIEGYEEAARVHTRYVEKLQEQIEAFDVVARELEELEGRDAPLSDHLRRAAGKLWP